MQRCSRSWIPLGLALLVAGPASAKNKDASQIPPIHLVKGIAVQPCDAAAPVQGSTEPSFRSDVPCLEARVELEHVSGPHKFRFLWYDADGNLYASTKKDWGFKPAEGKTGYHRTAKLRHKISVKGEQASFLAGSWKAVAELDDIHLAEARFKIEAVAVPMPATVQEAKKAYLDLQYDKTVETMTSWLNTQQPPAVEAQGRWWLALAQNALGKKDETQQTLAALLKADPTFSVTPEEAQSAGGEELRATLEEMRKSSHPDLYVKTGYPPQVELSGAEEAPVLGKRWPLWKKILVFGAAPVAVGAGAFFLARGSGSSGPEPLSITASIVGAPTDNPQLQCVPVQSNGTFTKMFNVDVKGGTGSYGITWNFNRAARNTQVTPPTATDVRQPSASYRIDGSSGFGAYIITVEVKDKGATDLPTARDSLALIFDFPSNCN
jgi:hypothetical protein